MQRNFMRIYSKFDEAPTAAFLISRMRDWLFLCKFVEIEKILFVNS